MTDSATPAHDVQWRELSVEILALLGRTTAFTIPMGWALSVCLFLAEIVMFGELIHPLSFFVVGPPIALTITALFFGGVKR